jgi:hypothetical protein
MSAARKTTTTTPAKPPPTHPNIDARARDAFWGAVVDCLEQFHGKPGPDAQALASALRARIEWPPPGIDGDLIYHAEPFDVACNLAQVELDPDTYRPAYELILRRHNW